MKSLFCWEVIFFTNMITASLDMFHLKAGGVTTKGAVNYHIRGPLWQTVGHPYSLRLASPTLPSRQQLSTAQAGGPPSVEMPRAAIGHFYKATLALKWLDLWSEHSLSTYLRPRFFDGCIITKSWLKLQLKNALLLQQEKFMKLDGS